MGREAEGVRIRYTLGHFFSNWRILWEIGAKFVPRFVNLIQNSQKLWVFLVGLMDWSFHFEVMKLNKQPFCFAYSIFLRNIKHRVACPNRVDFVRTKQSQRYSQAKCFLKAKCFGTVTPCQNSQTKKDKGLKFGPKVDFINGIADKKSQGAGYTSFRFIGEIRNFRTCTCTCHSKVPKQ